VLEEKVEEARKAVESIDLSRFNRLDNTGSGEEEPAATPATSPADILITTPGVIPAAPIVTPFVPGTSSEVASTSGVAGVRIGNIAAGAFEDGTGVEEDFVIAPNTDIIEDILGTDEDQTGRKLVMIEDNVVPLAAMPTEEGVDMSWWWLLIIFLLGATGKKMYDEHRKKVAAREEADR
nr:hypothetical protein [Lachnospiraceae bacterium]